jgi:transcriptional regulator with XRE-family HTH domain
MLEKRIAEKIREIRKTRGLTLHQLGHETGLSKALLSRIENNRVSPPIATLAKISQGLGVPISVFFSEEEEEGQSCAVTRKKDRKPLVRKGTKIGFTYYSLTSLTGPHTIEPFVVSYPVISKEPSLLFDHPGEEFVFVLKGKMELIHGKERIRLHSGDAAHFDPSVPHRGQNVGNSESECLVIVVEKKPTFNNERRKKG